MKLGEKIVAAEARINDIRDEVADIIKLANDESRDLLDEETDQIGLLEEESESTEKSLVGLKKAEMMLSRKAETREVQKERTVGIPARVKRDEGPIPVLTKMAVVTTLSHIKGVNPDAIIQERYSNDDRVKALHGLMSKAATGVATTFGSGWAAELVDDEMSGFINQLEPVSIYGRMAAGGVGIPFGDANSITMPLRSGQNTISGSWVGENATIPVKNDVYGSTVFNRYKAAVITPFTEELARVSTPQIEGLLRQGILLDTGNMLDNSLTDPANTGIAGIKPASPWNGASTQASAGVDQASILTDIKFLLNVLSSANAGRNPLMIMNPTRATSLALLTNANGAFVFRDEMSNGTIIGTPYMTSTNCPDDHVFIIDLADFGTAFGTPEMDISRETTLVMADDDGVAPTMADTNAVSVAGSLNVSDAAGTTPPTVVRSMFQTYSLALRMVLPVTWGQMRTNTLGYLTGVAW